MADIKDRMKNGIDNAADAAKNATDKAANVAQNARNDVPGLVDRAKETAHGLMDRANDVAGQARDKAQEWAGDAREAAQTYRKMLQMEPGDAHTWYNLALSLEKLGDRKGERDALERASALDSKMAPVHNQLAVLDLGEDQFAEAERHLQAALTIDPQFAEAQGNLGVIYDRQGKIGEAESLFRKAV